MHRDATPAQLEKALNLTTNASMHGGAINASVQRAIRYLTTEELIRLRRYAEAQALQANDPPPAEDNSLACDGEPARQHEPPARFSCQHGCAHRLSGFRTSDQICPP